MARTTHPATDYIRSLYAPEDALLSRINAELAHRNLSWQVGAEEGRMLQLLIALHGVKTVVEVGTLAGYSTLWMARALPAGGYIHTLELDAAHAAMARGFFAESEVAGRIELHEGNALAALEALTSKGPFDMIFIDADKGGYNAYLDWAEANVRKGGLIVADNTLLFGAVLEGGEATGESANRIAGMRRFNERLADRTRYNATMLPTEQGLSVAIKLF